MVSRPHPQTFQGKSFDGTGFLFSETVCIVIEQYKPFPVIIYVNAVWAVTVKVFPGFF